MNDYEAQLFRRKLQTSLDEVKLILDRQRAQGITAADSAPHRFQDKFLLVNQITNCFGISIFSALRSIGLTREKLVQLKKWAETASVSFRLVKDTTCTFVKEATRKEESARSVETEYSIGLLAGKSSSKVVTTITEFFYNYEVSFRIEAFRSVGDAPQDVLEIVSRTSRMECITRAKYFPFPESSTSSNEVNVSWFIRHLQLDTDSDNVNFDFQVNRENERKCRTATRNPEVEEAIAAMVPLRCWCQVVNQFFSRTVRDPMRQYQSEAYSQLDTNLLETSNLFIPVLAVFQNTESQEALSIEDANSTSETAITASASESTLVEKKDPIIDGEDIGALLDGHAACLQRKFSHFDDCFPSSTQLNVLLSNIEARIMIVVQHITDIIDRYRQTMDFMEQMLRTQIIAAIGREVTAEDFDKYMQFHYRKLYREEFAPRPWSMSVRRTPKHAPEGTVRIEVECSANDGGWQPVNTFCKSWYNQEEVHPMSFPINAATTISFQGSRHVHGYVSHAFQAPRSSTCSLHLRLVAAARQFSSFMVVLGRISSATTFDPKHAFIVENKEEMIIPLNGETIPSAKEFRDAIASLSPAQQRFAKAYRAMQLESTLFGVLLIQIKPPMERVLKLHPDSLTKEIKLSQDLLRLFLEYQISSDLLCCEEEVADASGDSARPATRIRTVQDNVRRVQEMIEVQVKQEIAEAKMSRAYEGSRNSVDQEFAGFTYSAAPPPPAPARSLASFAMARSMDPGAPPIPSGVSAPASTASLFVMELPQSAPAPPQAANQEESRANWIESLEPGEDVALIDVTKYPAQLDAAFDKLDPIQHAVRPTILHTGNTWQFIKQKPLALTSGSNGTSRVTPPAPTTINEVAQGHHRQRAFDLLDAMTRSGALLLQDCELHVVIAATHAFDRTLMNTLVQANENPIEDVERSSTILASTLHVLPAQQLVLPSHAQRLMLTNPQLF